LKRPRRIRRNFVTTHRRSPCRYCFFEDEELKQIWIEALLRGVKAAAGEQAFATFAETFDSESICFPCYGRALVEQMNRPLSDQSAGTRSSESGASGQEALQQQIEAELHASLVRDLLQELEEDDRGETRSMLSGASRIVDRVLPARMSKLLLHVRTKDAAAYLKRPDVREVVHAIVENALVSCHQHAQRLGQPLVVVGHSLGSVVLHNILSDSFREKVDLFVTIGSPLGARVFRENLVAWKSTKLWPAGVRTWVNVSNPHDPVCVAPALGRENFFRVSRPHDRADVLNLVDVPNSSDLHHGIDGYLSDPGVARAIARGLGAAL